MSREPVLGKTTILCNAMCLVMILSPGSALAQTTTETCCLPSGSCVDATPSNCTSIGGIPGGPGTSCQNNPNLCTERPCCLPDGTCVPGISPQHCQSHGGTPQPLGTICPPDNLCPQTNECAPTQDHKACRQTSCPVAGDKCTPRCIRYNPATGQIGVDDCDCRNPEECHAIIAAAAACTVPDNGSGTANLPPEGCAYTSPNGDMQIIDGLPPGDTIQIDSFFDVFYDITRSPGGSLGGEIEAYKATLHMPMTGTGGLSSFSRSLSMVIQCQSHAAPRTPGNPVQSFDTDMFYLQGQVTGDPDFDLLRVTAGTGFGMPSPGHTTLTQLPGGSWAVDSFFDITYRIDFVGSPGGPLAGQSGSTTGTIRMPSSSGLPRPDCTGFCPPGSICNKTITTNANGSITVCCDCDPPPPPVCRPASDGQSCTGDCLDPALKCLPTAWGVDPTGMPIILACDCKEVPTECRPSADGQSCVGDCLDPARECRPVAWGTDPVLGQVITECDCRGPEECQLQHIPGTPPQCLGLCPDGTPNCKPHQNSSGGFTCDCACLTDSDCDDGLLCTRDICDPATGQCTHIPVVCNDNDLCTSDECDPATGLCVYTTAVNCDDNNACTIEGCNPADGQCYYAMISCDDFNVCTDDKCDPQLGCLHTPVNCDDGDPCTNDVCTPSAGCVHTPIPDCTQVPKFSQLPSPDREDIPSNLWITQNGLQNPKSVVMDDFRSDGRPITSLRWWGSYLNPEYVPAEFGGFGQVPYSIDGWFISFHRPLSKLANFVPQRPLGLYFAPASAVKIIPRPDIPPCDNHPVFEYRVLLNQCCLVDSVRDVRLPTTNPHHCPAQPEAFYEHRCFWYQLDIQAVVGATWSKPTGASCCQMTLTPNIALGDFWGWHATQNERGIRPAIRSQVAVGTAPVAHPCPPLSQCPDSRPWSYGPWAAAQPVCPFPHKINMAFEILTNVAQVPPPCPPLILTGAVSTKSHTNPASPPATLDFHVPLPLDPPSDAAVECRTNGPTKVVLSFSEDIVADDESLDPGEEVSISVGTINGLSISGNRLTVDLSGVPSRACLQLSIKNGPEGITTIGGDPLDGDNDVHVASLKGDVNASRKVDSLDVLAVRGSLGQTVDGSNFKRDPNLSGTINSLDILLVRGALGHTVVCP